MLEIKHFLIVSDSLADYQFDGYRVSVKLKKMSFTANITDMATIIFDFDHTLLDSIKISDLIKDVYLKNGVSEETIEAIQTDQRSKNKDNPGLLEQVEHLKKLGHNIEPQDLNNFFNHDLRIYLKGPVHSVLETLFKKGHRLILLTKGIESFQRWKIKQSDIEKFFPEAIFVIDQNKEDIIKDLPLNGKIYFINDHADEIEAVAKIHPEINFIYVKGPKTSHDRFINHKHIPTIEDISSLPEIIGK